MNTSVQITHARAAAEAASAKLGINIVGIDVRRLTSVADIFLFVGATSHLHVAALEDAIRERLRMEGAALRRTDGHRGHSWRVLDYGYLLIHLFENKTREYYGLERLWDEGKKLTLLPEEKAPEVKAVLKKTVVRKKTSAKKRSAKPAFPKKASVKKTPVKKAAAKKASAKKSPAKKRPAKK